MCSSRSGCGHTLGVISSLERSLLRRFFSAGTFEAYVTVKAELASIVHQYFGSPYAYSSCAIPPTLARHAWGGLGFRHERQGPPYVL